MLNLNDLAAGNIPAITPAVGSALAEAGAICLESQQHVPGVDLSVRGDHEQAYPLAWQPPTEQARRSWNSPDTATEKGAESIAILIAKRAIGYSVIRQSRKGTGFDYWIGEESTEGFLDKAGLEISGIRRGNDRVVRARVREKLQQAKRHETWPTYVVVVEFGTPLTEVRKNESPRQTP